MITFKQFLLEEEDQPDFFKMLEHDCADFLRQSHRAGLIYRGIQETSLANHHDYAIHDAGRHGAIEMWEKLVKGQGGRSSRRPRDSSSSQHDAADAWFEQKFGVYARSKSLFASGNKHSLSDYGDTYIVLPKGHMSVIWSPKVDDMYGHFETGHWGTLRQGLRLGSVSEEEFWHQIGMDLDDQDYREGDLPAGIKSGNELMIQCNSYYIIPVADEAAIKHGLKIE